MEQYSPHLYTKYKWSKKASRIFSHWIGDKGLEKNFCHQWNTTSNIRKNWMIVTKAWSNLKMLHLLVTHTLEHLDYGRSRGSVQRIADQIAQDLQDPQTQSLQPFYGNTIPTDREFYTPEEFQLMQEASEFVIDQMSIPLPWYLLPHRVKWYDGTQDKRAWCRYKHNGLRRNAQKQLKDSRWYELAISSYRGPVRGNWYTYGRKSLGYIAQGIPYPDNKTAVILQLIHEYTHAWEHHYNWWRGRKFTSGETNTTLHELRWVKQHRPEMFAKLTKVQDGRRKEWFSPV